MSVLAVWTPLDGLLSVVAPLGLAAAAGTALIVDLDSAGPLYPGDSSLADLVVDGPRRADLTPSRSGVAVLRNGGIPADDARGVVEALIAGWPQVVLRVPDCSSAAGLAPLVPVRPLLPGILSPPDEVMSVFQRTGFAVAPPGSGPVLPRPRPGLLEGFLKGVIVRRSRWVSAWREVWRLSWR